MATHPSVLAWEIPWIEEPGRLQFMGVTKGRKQLSMHTQPNDRLGTRSRDTCLNKKLKKVGRKMGSMT